MWTSITVFVLADPNLSQEAGDKTSNETNFDSKHLTAFLRSASQVICCNHTQTSYCMNVFVAETDACCLLCLNQGHGGPAGRGSS